jgi:invasion protein IalB
MRRFHLVAVASLVGAACARGSSAEAPAQATPPDARAGSRAEGEAWTVALDASGECRAGRPCSARLRIAAKAGYHVNLDYPTLFRPAGSAGIDFAADRVPIGAALTRLPCADLLEQACEVSAPVPFVARANGPVRVAGTLAFSVCNPERCLIERVPLALALDAK